MSEQNLPPLPEPAEKQWFFCNKCGTSGHGAGWTHKRRDGSECGYMAAGRGPYFTADQMHSYALSAIAQLQERLEAAETNERRYLWLRDKADTYREDAPQVCITDWMGEIVSTHASAYPQGEALDAAIDAARASLSSEKQHG